MEQPPYLKVHQSRSHEPTVHDNLLGDALERAFAAGIADVPGIVARLSEASVPAPEGAEWSAALFLQELRRLGT